MDESLRQVLGALSIAMVVAIAARQVKLPYTIGLVVVGSLVAYSGSKIVPALTHDLIFDLILPPLLFEAALVLRRRDLQRDLPVILVLSILGTGIAAASVTFGVKYLLGWPTASALIFGTLISATDPVAIIAMFKDNRLKGRLVMLVESESLFNDGAAAVMFTLALSWFEAGEASAGAAAGFTALASIVIGGIGVGVLVGGAAIIAAERTKEHLIEVTLTMIAAFASFLAAEQLHVSGVLATVTAGLVMGNFETVHPRGAGFLTPKGREFIAAIWEFAAFLANSIVFLLIGVNVAKMPYQVYGGPVIAGAIVIVLLGRALAVYPLSLVFRGSRWALSMGEQHVLWWGGLRGALGLALALSLPDRLPLRDEIVVVTFGVAAFSIVVQGLTMPFLLRKLNVGRADRPG